jgi:hypothetical protein
MQSVSAVNHLRAGWIVYKVICCVPCFKFWDVVTLLLNEKLMIGSNFCFECQENYF